MPTNNQIWSRSRLVVKELMEAFARTRVIEGTVPSDIEYEFGNVEDAKFGRPPRLVWINTGGVALELVTAPPIIVMNPDGTTTKTTVPAVGYRRNNYVLRILERDAAQAEVVLDQMVTASQLIDRNDRVVFDKALWDFATEKDGKHLEGGMALIDVTVGVRVSIAKMPIGERRDVIVLGSEFRAGIENPPGEPLSEVEYDVDRGTGPWPG